MKIEGEINNIIEVYDILNKVKLFIFGIVF